MKELAAAKLILLIVSGSYLLSALMLLIARWRGQAVPAWMIGGWLFFGATGTVLSAYLKEGGRAIWIGLLAILGPWMIWSFIEDARRGYWLIAALDVAGLVAIGYALALCFKLVWK